MSSTPEREGTSLQSDATLDAIREVARLGARVSAGHRLEDTLQAVADGLVDSLGFGCVAVNYGLPGTDFTVVAVAGPAEARAALIGEVTKRSTFVDLLAASERWGPLRYLHDAPLAGPIEAGDITVWEPDLPDPVSPEDWHRDDMLLATLEDGEGNLIGILSLDLPPGGRRPGPLLCELVGVFAMQAGTAIASARLTDALLDERERLRLERSRLEASEAALRFTFAASAAGMATLHLPEVDPGAFRDVNDAFCRLVGFRHDELRYRRWSDLIVAEQRPAVVQELIDAAEGLHGQSVAERRIVRGDGTAVWLEVMSSVVAAGAEHPPFMLLQVQDVTARRALHANLVAQAHEDPLTGLVNRRRLLEHLSDVVARCRVSGARGALLYCDLDRFKQINDRYGHATGDLALREVADRLRAEVRSADVVARYGGDEFVVVAEEIDEDAIAVMVGRIRAAFDQPLTSVPERTNISVGVTFIDSLVLDPSEILHRGDVAMYGDKARAR